VSRLVTNHGRVLAYLARDPGARLREIAVGVGITERSASQIVSELERDGYLTKIRDGRRNRYRLDGKPVAGLAQVKAQTVGQVLAVLLDQQPLA
jgi:DNA-binding MarR family transcriptional regulator